MAMRLIPACVVLYFASVTERVSLRSVQVALTVEFLTEEQAPTVNSSIYIHGSNDEYLQVAKRFEAVQKI